MKKTLIIVAIVSAALLLTLVGCRAAPQVPGVTAVQSAMPTIPPMSASAGPTFGSTITMTPGATIPMVTTPGGLTSPKASMPPKTAPTKKK